MMRMSGTLLLCVCSLAASAQAQRPVVHARAKEHQRWPARIFAPYVDVARLPNNLPEIQKASGIRFFTLAFVNAGEGCTPTWPGAQSVANDTQISEYVQKLRVAGGDVIIAFGGYEGTELAQACTDAASLQAAYQTVINKYKAIILDFDIEHFAIEDQPSIDRRSQALKNLAHFNPGLKINFTLPATPSGLTASAVNVLKSAVAQGTPIHVVNLMTMDYGPTVTSKEMGANAIAAAEAAQKQIADLGLHVSLGITPMLGMNDVAGETFTLADAAAVLSYALQSRNVALLAFWSVGRDNGSCGAQVLPTCSGLAQQTWEFAHVFEAFH